MYSMSSCIPYEFLAKKVDLTWREVTYGIAHGIFSPYSAVKLATQRTKAVDDYSEPLFELASLIKGDTVHPYVDDLADSEPEQSSESIQDKWLYLVLSWVYEDRDRFDDPLRMVADVYADFDYPESIKSFVH